MSHCIKVQNFCVGILLLVVLISGVSQAEAIYQTPLDVLYSSGSSYDDLPAYAASKAIDGDLTSYCCLWDDTTVEGANPGAIPVDAVASTTGYIIFDMGEVLNITGVQLTARDEVNAYNPKAVEFFYFMNGIPSNPGNSVNIDIDNDANLKWLASTTFGALTDGASGTDTWNAATTRYIGMKVDSSYAEGPTHFNYQITEIDFLVTEVPEPSTVALLFGALVFMVVRYRTKK